LQGWFSMSASPLDLREQIYTGRRGAVGKLACKTAPLLPVLEDLAYRKGMAKALVALILSSVLPKYQDSIKNQSLSLESAS
jgi:hypothetical protein